MAVVAGRECDGEHSHHLNALHAHLTREMAKAKGRIARKLPVSELNQYTLEAYLAWAAHGLEMIAAELRPGARPAASDAMAA